MPDYSKKLEELGLTDKHAAAVKRGLEELHGALCHLSPKAMAMVDGIGLDNIMADFCNTEGLSPVSNPCRKIAMRTYGKVL